MIRGASRRVSRAGREQTVGQQTSASLQLSDPPTTLYDQTSSLRPSIHLLIFILSLTKSFE